MSPQPAQKNSTLRFILLIVFLLVCFFIGRLFKLDLTSTRTFFHQFPLVLSGCVFVLVYVLSTTFIIVGPKDILRVSSALIFGGVVSTILVTAGEWINAAVMFQLSRRLGRDYVEQKFNLKTKDIEQTNRNTHFLWVLALRFNPLIPFRFLDLGYGLSSISFKRYYLAVLIASPVRVFWLQSILAATGELMLERPMEMMTYFVDHPRIVQLSGFYFLFIVVLTIAAAVVRGRRAKAS